MINMLKVMAIAAIIQLTVHADEVANKSAPIKSRRNKTNFIYSDSNIEHPEFNNNTKLSVEGGLYTD